MPKQRLKPIPKPNQNLILSSQGRIGSGQRITSYRYNKEGQCYTGLHYATL